jgi:hypothetical protein
VSTKTLALVESATQLINVAEWAYAAGETERFHVAVLAPRDPYTVRQIARVSELVQGLGIDVRSYPVRRPRPGAVSGVVQIMRHMATAQRLVIGDPFSRFIQTLLPVAAASDVVVVDDGTATWEFARCINAAEPLVRWDAQPSGPESRAGRACRLLSPSVDRELTVFSCLNDATPIAATGLANRFEWARSTSRPTVVDDEIDVLGVSLVDNGVIERDAYVDAVARLARRDAPVRYVAHRRESDSLVAEIAALPGVRVVRLDMPVELALRRGPVARHVIIFPSTAAHTLPVVLGGAGVRFEVRHIDPAWFTPTVTSRARDFVTRIAAAAPSRPILEIA